MGLRRGEAGDAETLASACCTGEKSNPGARNVKAFCEEGYERVVGSAVCGWCGQRNFDCAVVDPDDDIRPCSGMDADAQNTAVGDVADCYGDHHSPVVAEAGYWRLPKRAVPTRMHVLPSSMATTKSFDIPIESWVSLG